MLKDAAVKLEILHPHDATDKVMAKLRAFIELTRERRIDYKEENVARDRIELPTRGFSVLIQYRDYVSLLVVN